MDHDWEKRVLCSDGNCIGVIGADGRCKECGKPYEGRLPDNFDTRPSTAAPEPEAPSEPENTAGDAHRASADRLDSVQQTAGGGEDDDWEKRVLCSDGNCIGVIGADGRCKECGKPYTPDFAEP